MSGPYVVVVNLLPQTVTMEDKAHVLSQVHARRETILQSADDAARLVARGIGLVQWQARGGRRSWAVEVIPAADQAPNERERIDCL